jgi:heme-degrading monooxygenase HmoA
MILRMWKARSTARQATAYIQHATKKVFPKLRTIEGHRGEYLLRRQAEDGVELVVLTLWDSMEAVRRFAGPEPDKAVVEPEARAVLTSFDEYVTHFDVVEGTEAREKER